MISYNKVIVTWRYRELLLAIVISLISMLKLQGSAAGFCFILDDRYQI